MKKKRLCNAVVCTGLLVTGLIALPATSCRAQGGFAYRASLDTIKQAAFYRITLQPGLVAKSRVDMADLRIADAENRFIPYVLQRAQPVLTRDRSGEPLKAGASIRGFKNGQYLDIPDPLITQKDSSNKHSYITLQYDEAYQIDKLDLHIEGPVLYKRHAGIWDSVSTGEWRVAEITIDPGDTSFSIPSVRTSRLLIDIANEDNVPLHIRKAGTGQLDQYLLTYLQPGGVYHLLTGNSRAVTPDYDLRYFVDSLTKDPQELLAGPLLPMGGEPGPGAAPGSGTMQGSGAAPSKEAVSGKDHSRVILWSIIGLALVLLIFLSFKMMKAIPQKENDESGG
jgi:hypothetical protein